MTISKNRIDEFNFPEGKIITRKYEILFKVGSGWEGEVYMVKEKSTGITRTAKFLYPHRNKGNKTSNFYAKKLHKLRACNVIIPYHLQDQITFKKQPITFLISDYVEGDTLTEFIKNERGKRLNVFQALHLLHSLISGVEAIHKLKEYHGDLHEENIIIKRYGLQFKLCFLDVANWGKVTREHFHDDIVDAIKVFYFVLGGKKHYAKQPKEVKAICCGLKRGLILKKFRSATKLREHLENISW